MRSCYDEGKRVAETLMFDYHRQHGIGEFIGYVIRTLFSMQLFISLMSIYHCRDKDCKDL